MAKRDTIVAFPEIAAVPTVARGKQAKGFEFVQKYLNRFGYLAEREIADAGVLDNTTSTLLKRFQRKHGLKETGQFDSATREAMTTTRCGLPDMSNGVDFATTCAWNRCNLTFAFDVGTNDIPLQGEFQAVRNAFSTWASVVNFTFTEVAPGANPDVLIGWRPANDPDHNMVGGVLAHADFPPGCSVVTNTLPKPVHFDDTEHTWNIGAAPNTFDVETVALHELGHILGLAHSNVAGSVMFPSVSSNFTKRALTQDDIDGIRSLYPGCGTPIIPIGPITAITPLTAITPMTLITPITTITPITPITAVLPITAIQPITPITPIIPINPIRPVRPARPGVSRKKR
jgi:matrixin/putative peptidoglycan binding protein